MRGMAYAGFWTGAMFRTETTRSGDESADGTTAAPTRTPPEVPDPSAPTLLGQELRDVFVVPGVTVAGRQEQAQKESVQTVCSHCSFRLRRTSRIRGRRTEVRRTWSGRSGLRYLLSPEPRRHWGLRGVPEPRTYGVRDTSVVTCTSRRDSAPCPSVPFPRTPPRVLAPWALVVVPDEERPAVCSRHQPPPSGILRPTTRTVGGHPSGEPTDPGV